jgi:hypothetical protein
MKITTGLTTVLTCSLCFCFIVTAWACPVAQDDDPVSVLNSVVAPAPVAALETVQSPLPLGFQSQQPFPAYLAEPAPSVMMEAQPMYHPIVSAPVVSGCCQQCHRKKCRCPKPAAVPMEFCLVDPCGCSHDACVEVPVCCLGEHPEISWRQGVRGRQIATLCWKCCDHQVKVVVTGVGKVRVRD